MTIEHAGHAIRVLTTISPDWLRTYFKITNDLVAVKVEGDDLIIPFYMLVKQDSDCRHLVSSKQVTLVCAPPIHELDKTQFSPVVWGLYGLCDLSSGGCMQWESQTFGNDMVFRVSEDHVDAHILQTGIYRIEYSIPTPPSSICPKNPYGYIHIDKQEIRPLWSPGGGVLIERIIQNSIISVYMCHPPSCQPNYMYVTKL